MFLSARCSERGNCTRDPETTLKFWSPSFLHQSPALNIQFTLNDQHTTTLGGGCAIWLALTAEIVRRDRNGTAPGIQSITRFKGWAERGSHRTPQLPWEQAGLRRGAAQSQAPAPVLRLWNRLGHHKFWECFNPDNVEYFQRNCNLITDFFILFPCIPQQLSSFKRNL